MAMVYPVTGEARDESDEAQWETFAKDWSETWVIEVDPDPLDEDVDTAHIGPLGPREAWDLANKMWDLRPDWTFVLMAVFEPEDAQTLVEHLEESSQG